MTTHSISSAHTHDRSGAPATDGPRGHWLLGSLAEFRTDQLGFYERCRDEYGGCVPFRLAHHRMMLVLDPDSIEQVLVTHNRDFRKHYMLRLLDPLLGNGVLSSEGTFWLRQRRLMQPLFTRERIAGHGRAFVRLTEREIATWQDGETRDVHADMQRLTMAIAAETLMGVDVEGDDYAAVQTSHEHVAKDFAWRFQRAFTLPYWVPTPRNRRLRAAIRKLEDVVHEMIRRKRAKEGTGNDLLARLVEARDEDDGRGMTDVQLRDEVMTLFLAGHETTANALSWTFDLLGRHPDVSRRLRDELLGVLGDRFPTIEELDRLPLTRQVLKESMRLYPPAYAFGREAMHDTEIGGRTVKRGTTVILPQWAVHRDPGFYDDPTEFRPDRWTPEFEADLPRYAYFPFGGGPRVCIGNAFAMLEATLVLATIHRRFELRRLSDRPTVPFPSITLRPEGGIPVRVANVGHGLATNQDRAPRDSASEHAR